MRYALLLLAFGACARAKSDAGGEAAAPPKASASSSSPAAAASSGASNAAAWYAGSWHGAFQAELSRVEAGPGAVKEWQRDDGKQASGRGELSLTVNADGTALGTATGALGDLSVNGRVEGERAALQLASADATGFHGVILANQTPDGMSGTLSASSGDSLLVRQARVTLTRN